MKQGKHASRCITACPTGQCENYQMASSGTGQSESYLLVQLDSLQAIYLEVELDSLKATW